MGAAKTISQGNPPSDDTMRKYMTYQQEAERRLQERAGSQGNLSDAERRMQETEMRYRNQEPQMRAERRMQERAGSQGNLSDAERRMQETEMRYRNQEPQMRAERRMQETEMRYRNQEPQMRSGINLGPGRANRTPEQGSREYEQLLQQIRSRNKGRR
jgi:hypothetical protein